jgi:hypothetical protein
MTPNRLVATRLKQIRASFELLNSWANPTDEERQEQAETWEYLKRAIDEDRPDGAKLYA